MFPFVVDHRATIEPSVFLYNTTKSAFHRKSRGRKTSTSSRPSSNSESSPPPTTAAALKPTSSNSCGTGGGNAFRNPYSFTDSPPRNPSAIILILILLKLIKIRLAAINSAYDTHYGSADQSTNATAEELRHTQAQTDRRMKDLEAGVPSAPHPHGNRSSTSTTSSSSSGSDEDRPARKHRRSLKDRLLRRNKASTDETEGLMDASEGRKLRKGPTSNVYNQSSWEDQYFIGSMPIY